MPHIKVIEHGEAEGELKEIYDNLIKTRGGLAEVHKIHSLNPATLVAHMELYLSIMFKRSPLKRYQREMMAVVTSKYNNCSYCILHHKEALDHFWKDEAKSQQVIDDYQQADLSIVDKKLCELAHILTVDPAYTGKEERIEGLKTLGLEDRAILDATLVIAYFNFVNRLVLNLGVYPEEQGVGGYKYD